MRIRNARFIGVFVAILAGVTVLGIWAMRPIDEEHGAPGPAPGMDERESRPEIAGVGSIAGEVRIFKTGAAAAGTAVRVEGGGEPLVLETDAEGRFRSPVPSGVELTVTVEAAAPLAPVVLRGLLVEAGMTEDLGTLYLERSFRVRGEVVDRAGQALAGARVEVFRSAEEKAQPGFDILSLLTEMGEVRTPLEATETAADGSFVLGSLSPGSYRIEASFEGMAVGVLPRATVSPAREDATLRIVLGPGAALLGTVKNSKGIPVEGAAVTVIRGAFFGPGEVDLRPVQTLTDAKGDYAFTSLSPGEAMLMVRAEGYGLHVSGDVVIGRTERHDVTIGGGAGMRGRVTDDDGKPIEGAEVVFAVETEQNGGILRRGLTDGDGRYEVGNLPARKVEMFAVRKDGYPPFPSAADRFGPGESVGSLEEGKFLTKDVTLSTGTALIGRVTDEATGHPIPGAEVSAMSPSVMGLGKGPRVVTDASGAFRLEGLGEGVHLVFVRAPGYSQTSMSEQMLQNAFGFNSGEGPPPEAPVVKIQGKPAEITKDLVLQPGVTIGGRVLSPAGDPVGGARVSVAAGENDQMAAFFQYFKLAPPPVLTDETGGFRITGAPAGDEMRLAAESEGFVKGFSEPFRAAAGGVANEVTIRLRAGGSLAGTVLGNDGQPLKGALVRLIPAPEGEEERSWNAEWLLMQAMAHAVGDDGTFRIDGLAPGAVWTRIEGPGHQTTTRTDLSVPEGGVSGGNVVQLEQGFAITGRVTAEDGEPLPGVEIGAHRENEDRPGIPTFSYESWRTDADGKFAIDRLAPGAYALRFQAEGYATDSRPGVAAGTRDLSIVLARGLTIEGTVYLPDGSPAPNIWVTAQPDDAVVGSDSGMTDAKGRFVIEDLPSGDYTIEPHAMGQGDRQNVRMVKATGIRAGARNVEIRLLSGYTISGVVVDGAGQPVAGANVWTTPMNERGQSREAPSGWATSRRDGTFEVGGLDDGRYRVSAHHGDRTASGANNQSGGATDVRIVLDARTEPLREGSRSGIGEAEPVEVPEEKPR